MIRLVRDQGRELFAAERLTPLSVRDFISDRYRDLDVRFVDRSGNEVFLPTEILDPPDFDISYELAIDEEEGRKFDDALRKFIERNFFDPLPACVMPRVRKNNQDWFILIASFIIAVCNEESANWPRNFADNDNELYPPIAANDNHSAEMRI